MPPGCVASSAAIFAVSMDDPPPSPTKPSKPPSRAASTASATDDSLGSMPLSAKTSASTPAARIASTTGSIRPIARELRVGDDERARHARLAQVPAGLERRARPEHERRAGDGEDALVGAHGITSHSSLPRVSLSSSNGIMRGTIARVEPVLAQRCGELLRRLRRGEQRRGRDTARSRSRAPRRPPRRGRASCRTPRR